MTYKMKQFILKDHFDAVGIADLGLFGRFYTTHRGFYRGAIIRAVVQAGRACLDHAARVSRRIF
jgi:hypothetical protein